MIADRIVTDRGGQEIARHYLRALMYQLVERVLPVCSRLSPYDRTCLIHHRISSSVDGFSIALHVALLEVRGKPMEILIVWQDGFRCCAEKIVIPHADERQYYGDVFLERGITEMDV